MNAPVEFSRYAPACCPMCGSPAKPRMLVAHIQAVVSSYYRIRHDYMWSAQRGRDVARPRQIAMYLSRELTPLSLPAIAKRFHRDHTTVMYACKHIEDLMEKDFEIADDVMVLRERLIADQVPLVAA
jgi:chromosomal replication initiator protein